MSGLKHSLLILLPALLLQGCLVTMDKHTALASRVEESEKNIDVLDAQQKRNLEQIENVKTYVDTQNQDLRDQLANLRADLEETQNMLKAAVGQQEELLFKVEQVKGNVKGLEGVVESKLSGDTGILPENLPAEPATLYAMGLERLGSGQVKTAFAIFQEFLRRYPEDEKADDAQFHLGEALFAAGQFDKAIEAYRKVYEQYQRGDKYKESVLRIGLCYERQNNCKKAIKIYEFASEEFKKSSEGKKARERAAALKDSCR